MNIYYTRSGDYYIPDLTLPEETRPIGKWGGGMQWEYRSPPQRQRRIKEVRGNSSCMDEGRQRQLLYHIHK